jgi:two-component system OmpR family sensor kinase
MLRPRTLRSQLALLYAIALLLVLATFAGTLYFVIEAEEASEPAQVRALEPPEHTGRTLLYGLAFALPVAAAVAIVGAALVARRSLRPLEDVVSTASRISTESLDQRIPLSPAATVEINTLIQTLNGMLERLERSVGAMRRFTADASHELRTPLAALRTEIEITLRRQRSSEELLASAESTLDSIGRLSRLVETLLLLARSDTGNLPVSAVDLDLGEIVRRAIEPYEPVVSARNVRLRWCAPETIHASGDPLLTARAVANLIDNAAKFTPDGGEICIAISHESARARFEIGNTAPDLRPDELDRLFERFFRAENARTRADGSGLGLALARELVEVQGGTLSAKTSNAGVVFQLELPRA